MTAHGEQLKALVQQALDTPPSELEEFYNTLSNAAYSEAAQELNALAQAAALRAEYLENMRDGAGHTQSAKLAVCVLNKVRKAMGYTYKKNFSF